MLDALSLIAPVVAGLLLGFALKQSGVVKRSDGEMLFRLLFFTGIPALMFSVLSTVEITRSLLVFPMTAFFAVTGGYLAGKLMLRFTSLDSAKRPVFVMACMIVNSGFALPFINAVYGAEGVARLAAFDAINALLAYSWGHGVAQRNNPESAERWSPTRLLKSPPLIGIVLGLLVNMAGLNLPSAISHTTQQIGAITPMLTTLAIGMMFSPALDHLRGAVLAIGTRLSVSVLVAAIVILAFGLSGADAGAILFLATAPIGFNTVTFASLERLDADFAARILSLSLVTGLLCAVGVAVVMH